MGFGLLGVTALSSAFIPKTDWHPVKSLNPQPFFDPSQFVQFTVTGYNEDVIANGFGSSATTTTNSVDNSNYAFYEIGSQFSTGGAVMTNGLPADGVLTSPDVSGLTFQMESYDSNNALRIQTENATESITFSETGMYEALYFAVTTGDGSSDISGTINFSDNTTQTFSSLFIPDWYNSTSLPVLISGIGRVSTVDDGVQTPSGNPRIYQLTIGIDALNQSKTITGVTITKEGSGDTFNLFAVSGKIAPTCASPENITISSVSTDGAELVWGDSADSYEYAYVPAGDPAPTAGTTVTTAAASITGSLMANTSYDFYLRAYCSSVSDYSFWVGPFTFTTACGVATTITENFDASSDMPSCWDVINGGINGDDPYGWEVYSYSGESGSHSVRIRSNWVTHNDYLILPQLAVSAHVNDLLEFYSRNSGTSNQQTFDVVVSTTGTAEADFTDVLATYTPGTSYTMYSIDLSAYDGQDIYVALHTTTTSAYNYYYLYVDTFTTTGVPYCDAPTALTGAVTPTSASLSWTDDLGSAWEVAVQDAGAGEPVSGAAVTEATYSYSLMYGELKEFYVRTACDGGGFSPWAGPYVFGGSTMLEVTSGYSDDVIANGVGDALMSTTNAVDDGNWAYLSRDFKATDSAADLTYGLPIDGGIASSYVSGLNYQLADYDGNNSLRISTAGNNGTLVFNKSYKAEKLYLLVVSGSGDGMLSGTIHFTDGTTQAIVSAYTPDWFYETTLPVAISGIGRINRTNNNLENPSNNPRIYEMEIAIDSGNEDKVISSVDVAKDSGGVINIFAASISFSSAAFATDNLNQHVVNVYPNPVTDNLHITGVDATAVNVYTITGQKVAVDFQNNSINMSALKRGVYLVTVYSENGSETLRVIKN